VAPLTAPLLAATTGDPHLHWPWLVVALGVVVLALLVVWSRGERRRPRSAAYVAHAARLRALPRYRALVRRRTAVGAALSLAALVACSGAVVLAGRVQQTRTTQQDTSSRDIMLCLDSSGSMMAIDQEVLAQFQQIVAGLHGDRIGLTIWSGAAVTIFPLTDDYDFVQRQLEQAAAAFAPPVSSDPFSDPFSNPFSQAYPNAYLRFTRGTVVPGTGSSQAGDGLASCVQRFDRSSEHRSRAVVLATDDQPVGRGVYTLGQASAYAKAHHVVVHAIAAPTITERPGALPELRGAALRTGGTFSLLGQDGSVATVVGAIERLRAATIHEPPVVRTVDEPHLGTVLAGIGVGLLVVVWLVEGLLWLLDRDGGPA
jgi:hypothetical protein